jgi:hypothetical protein
MGTLALKSVPWHGSEMPLIIAGFLRTPVTNSMNDEPLTEGNECSGSLAFYLPGCIPKDL